MNKCCENRMTSFCPECGTNLHGHPLQALLLHVQKNATEYEKKVADYGPSWSAASEKWSGWAVALKELMGQACGTA